MGQEYKEKLKELDLPGDTWVTLTNSDFAEVLHYKDDAVNDAVGETDVVRWFSELVMALPATRREGILTDLEDACGLEIPDSEDENAEPLDAGQVHDAIVNNFYDQEFISHEIKKYDHKRGRCTLTATLEITLDELLNLDYNLSGWTIEVETKRGTLGIEV
jgi:hypothetical protein